mmetsp:Transcript_28564/g.72343  ORF Transcript_28564/g.72343 Transcript_28564/m.72343 type:complete len:214 (+) Transcript_28564:217-858(+)
MRRFAAARLLSFRLRLFLLFLCVLLFLLGLLGSSFKVLFADFRPVDLATCLDDHDSGLCSLRRSSRRLHSECPGRRTKCHCAQLLGDVGPAQLDNTGIEREHRQGGAREQASAAAIHHDLVRRPCPRSASFGGAPQQLGGAGAPVEAVQGAAGVAQVDQRGTAKGTCIQSSHHFGNFGTLGYSGCRSHVPELHSPAGKRHHFKGADSAAGREG